MSIPVLNTWNSEAAGDGGTSGFTVTVDGATAGNLLVAVANTRGDGLSTIPGYTELGNVITSDPLTYPEWRTTMFVRTASGTTGGPGTDDAEWSIDVADRCFIAIAEYDTTELPTIAEYSDSNLGMDRSSPIPLTTDTGAIIPPSQPGTAIAVLALRDWSYEGTPTLSNGTIDFVRTVGSASRGSVTLGQFDYTSVASQEETWTITGKTGDGIQAGVALFAVPTSGGGGTAPTIADPTPSDPTVIEGVNVTFTGSQTGGDPATSYEWYKNGSPLSNDSLTLDLTSVTSGDDGAYTYDATNAIGTSPVSGATTLTVVPPGSAVVQWESGLPVRSFFTYPARLDNLQAKVTRQVRLVSGSPAQLFYRIVDNATGTPIAGADWTAFGPAGPSAGVYDIDVDQDVDTRDLRFEVRPDADDGAKITETNLWNIGFKFVVAYSQSNGQGFNSNSFSGGTDTTPAVQGYWTVNNVGLITQCVEGGAGHEMARLICGVMGASLTMQNQAVGSSPMTQDAWVSATGGDPDSPIATQDWWANPEGGYVTGWKNRVGGFTDDTNMITGFIKTQGGTDAIEGTPEFDGYLFPQVLGGLSYAVGDARDYVTTPDGSPALFMGNTLGSLPGTQEGCQGVRTAEMEAAKFDPHYLTENIMTVVSHDEKHWNIATRPRVGHQYGMAFLHHVGAIDAPQPEVVGYKTDDTRLHLDVYFNQDMDGTDTNYTFVNDFVRVTDSSGANAVTGFTRQSARIFRVALTRALASDVHLQIGYGQGQYDAVDNMVIPRGMDVALPNLGGVGFRLMLPVDVMLDEI